MTRTRVVRRIDWRKVRAERDAGATDREWLVTNGLGGYASGTVSNVVTRRYHGLLIAALPAPMGRMLMLSKVWERARLPDRRIAVIDGEPEVGESQATMVPNTSSSFVWRWVSRNGGTTWAPR